jgi:hypothetical protein
LPFLPIARKHPDKPFQSAASREFPLQQKIMGGVALAKQQPVLAHAQRDPRAAGRSSRLGCCRCRSKGPARVVAEAEVRLFALRRRTKSSNRTNADADSGSKRVCWPFNGQYILD